jgi:heat shock protein HspQ
MTHTSPGTEIKLSHMCFANQSSNYIQTISEHKVKQFKSQKPNKEPSISDLARMISDVHPKYRSEVMQKIIYLTQRT